MSGNYKEVSKVLWIILFANFLVAILKIIFGNIIKSSSMVADGFHSFADGSSNIAGLVGIKFASKPKDEDHPYGHKKFEMLSSLFISGMLFFLSFKVIIDAFKNFLNPVKPQITILSLIALLSTLIINIIISTLEYRKGKSLNSHILISDSIHTRSDIIISLGVLVTLIGVKLGLPFMIDSIVSLIVAGFIFHSAYKIFESSSGVLLDKKMVDRDEVKEIIMKYSQVKDVHKIRSRGKNDDIYIDLHIMLEPKTTIEESHNLIHKIEYELREEINENIEIIAHFEPYK